MTDRLADAIARALPVGRQTEERACRVLEQQLGAVWAAVLESHGYDPAQGYRVAVAGLAVEPAPPNAGEPPPVDGRIPAAAVGPQP